VAHDPAEIMGALKATGGKIYLAAEALGITPKTIRNHMKKNPEMAEFVEDSRVKMVDIAEQKFNEAIQNGEHWAIAMALKTLGKDRGFVERTEVVNSGELKMYGVEAPVDEV